MKNERWVTHGCTVTTADDWQDGNNHGGKFVASTYDGAWSDHVPTDEEAAMAEKIAVLPELVEALEGMVDAWDNGCLRDPSDVDTAKAALKKARGEA